jgi:hypothetical protein
MMRFCPEMIYMTTISREQVIPSEHTSLGSRILNCPQLSHLKMDMRRKLSGMYDQGKKADADKLLGTMRCLHCGSWGHFVVGCPDLQFTTKDERWGIADLYRESGQEAAHKKVSKIRAQQQAAAKKQATAKPNAKLVVKLPGQQPSLPAVQPPSLPPQKPPPSPSTATAPHVPAATHPAAAMASMLLGPAVDRTEVQDGQKEQELPSQQPQVASIGAAVGPHVGMDRGQRADNESVFDIPFGGSGCQSTLPLSGDPPFTPAQLCLPLSGCLPAHLGVQTCRSTRFVTTSVVCRRPVP